MPSLQLSTPDKIIVNTVKTNLHNEESSIRKKLINKINKQNQMTKCRNNYAVIDLNNHIIANDFTVQASLSDVLKLDDNVT